MWYEYHKINAQNKRACNKLHTLFGNKQIFADKLALSKPKMHLYTWSENEVRFQALQLLFRTPLKGRIEQKQRG